jgi:N-methylhydantoinase A
VRVLGVDIGGTHTDVVYAADGALRIAKVPTRAGDLATALFDGAAIVDAPIETLDLVIHGTTVATNAVIERKGARCGLITTLGFRDVLELRRRDRPHTYGLEADFRPLIERRDRREVPERVGADGTIRLPVDLDAVQREAVTLAAVGCEVLVIAFLHAYANPANERAATAAAREVWPNDFIVAASELLPSIREFERTSTAVIGGYVQPHVAHYMADLSARLEKRQYRRDLLVVQSNGGIMTGSLATRFAAHTILSGPAAGVTAAVAVAGAVGERDVISCDMGGTSLDLCVIQDGTPARTQTKTLEFGIPLCLPMLDIDIVGLGGGSLARVDGAGILTIGPDSAGADPGPACYGRGGEEPTITDACVATGMIEPSMVIGGAQGWKMEPALARRAIADYLAGPLGLGIEEAAEAILVLTGHTIAGRIRRTLLQRGLDPRGFALAAFGGAGPLHACRILREGGLARALIPLHPGLTSAMGCLLGRLRHDLLKTVNKPLGALDRSAIAEIYAEQAAHGLRLLAEEGVALEDADVWHGADMSYVGQLHAIPVRFSPDKALDVANVRGTFEAAYRARYTRLLDGKESVLVNATTTVSGPPAVEGWDAAPQAVVDRPPDPRPTRLFLDGAWREVACYERSALPPETSIAGPAVISQPDTVTLIEPGFNGYIHRSGTMIIEAGS